MRRLSLLALASVSLVALVTVATSSYSATPQNLGTLKQLDKWKVGIVDPQGQAFCAMVSKFDKGTGLAFAMSPEGYGSVALDLSDKTFTAGNDYQVALKTDGNKAGSFPARATSDRSVVVQVGQSKSLYDALKSDAVLGMGLPSIEASFAVSNFGKSYASLVDCSQTLGKKDNTTASAGPNMPAVKVKEVEQAPLDRELDKLSGAQVADAGDVKGKAASFDDAEAKLDKADGDKADKSAAADDVKTPAPAKADITWNDKPADTDVKAAAKPARKLLASSSAVAAAPVKSADSAATARKLDDEQASAADKTAAAEKAAAAAAPSKALDDQKQAQAKLDAAKADQDLIAALKADKKQAEAQHAADVAKQQELDQKLAALQKEVADAKKTQGDDANRGEQMAALQQKLAATQDEYKTKVAAVETERDTLKKQLADAVAAQKVSSDKIAALQGQIDAAATREASAAKENAAQKQKLADLADQLKKSDDEKQSLKDRIAAMEKDGKASEQALLDRKKDLEASAADSKELRRVKSDLENMKAENAATVAKLQKQLADKSQQYDALSARIAAAHSATDVAGTESDKLSKQRAELTAQLAQKQARVDELQGKLQKLEGERTKALALADQAQTEVKQLRKSLVVINDDELPADQKAKAKAELMADKEKSELNDARLRTALLESQLEAAHDPDSPDYAAAQAKRLVSPDEKTHLSAQDADAAHIVAGDAKSETLVAVTAPLPHRRPGVARALLAQRQAERRLQAIEPAAGAAAPHSAKATVSDDWFNGKSGDGNLDRVMASAMPKSKPATAAVDKTADDKTDDEAVSDSTNNAAGKFDENRASAFLDRIMSYHTGGKPAPVKDETPVFGSAESKHAPKPVPTAALNTAPVKTAATSQAAKLAIIETAAGDATVPLGDQSLLAAKASGMKSGDEKASDDKTADKSSVISWLSPSAEKPVTKTAAVSAPKQLPVESILSKAGVRDATFADAQTKKDGVTLREWTTGDGISGMYEQTAATRSFDVNVQKYLDRYRKDCKDLKVKLSQPEASGDVMFSEANISCAMRGNNYSTSMVFAQNDDSFNAILHSGFPSDAAEVRNIGSNVAKAIAKANNPLTHDIDTAVAETHDSGLEIVVPGKPVASRKSGTSDGDAVAQ